MSATPSRVVMVGIAVIAVAFLAVFSITRLGSNPPDLASRDTSESGKEAVVTHRVDGRHWVVAQADKEEYLKDLSAVSKQILLKPNLGDKKDSVTHITIFKLSEDSPMHAAGLRKDDQIVKVNGTPIETMGRAINLIHEVKRSDDLTVQVRRGEELLEYRFEFR